MTTQDPALQRIESIARKELQQFPADAERVARGRARELRHEWDEVQRHVTYDAELEAEAVRGMRRAEGRRLPPMGGPA